LWRWGGRQVGWAASLQELAEGGGLQHQPLDVDRHTRRSIRLQLGQPVTQLRHGAAPVAAAPVVKADAHLEDALVEIADRIGLPDPYSLERLMLFEELLTVALHDALQQRRRRRIIAARGAARRRLLQAHAHAVAPLAAAARAESPLRAAAC